MEKLREIEAGQTFPTRALLSKFSAVYRRPLITFYMKEPPRKGLRGEDFRTLSTPVSGRENAVLDALLRDVRARQEMVKSLLEDEEEARPLPFVGSAKREDGVGAVVNAIAKTLGYDPDAQPRGRRGTGVDDLFKDLRTRAEGVGIFVLLMGDLGSRHSTISEAVFRGFTIADKIAPFVIINDRDARAARSFTLLHELAHLWLGQTGVSGAVETAEISSRVGVIERFCNDVAGEFLLPSAAFKDRPEMLEAATKDAAHRVVSDLARTWSVSESMMAYKLARIGWIGGALYQDLAADFAARWQARKDRAEENKKEGGPSYYVVKRFKLGDALVDVVRRTLRDNLITHTKAAKVLGVKPGSVDPLIRNFEKTKGVFLPDSRG
ncbi:hypothetical protein F11_02755 [Rhodospirillum rubrum F11]|nr:hypothetical protein F11_02755 [Rhodospirillum rubrum F11]